jgi:hypothetical protein
MKTVGHFSERGVGIVSHMNTRLPNLSYFFLFCSTKTRKKIPESARND